jgi:hypothetical protein
VLRGAPGLRSGDEPTTTVPPKSEVAATLTLTAYTPGSEVEAEIYVEDLPGLTVLKVMAGGAKSGPRAE